MSETIDQQQATVSYSLWQIVLYALKLGSIGFGGPIALIGYMHRDLVEAPPKGWGKGASSL